MSAHDILESILDPSKVIVDQYQNTVLTLTNDDVVIGRVISEDDKKLVVLTDGMNMTREMIFKTNIVSRRVSKISPMPEGLVNFMNEDQIWDLIAYLESGGQIPSRLKK
jgi:putative heme-binding domain-containing protein